MKLIPVNSRIYACACINVGLDNKISCPEARDELMKVAAKSYLTEKNTDPLGTPVMVPPPSPIVEKAVVVQTTNLGGEIGSADVTLPAELSPLKKPPPPVVANKPVDLQLPFRSIQTNDHMTSLQQQRIVTVLETVQPGKNGSNLVLDAVAKMVSLLYM